MLYAPRETDAAEKTDDNHIVLLTKARGGLEAVVVLNDESNLYYEVVVYINNSKQYTLTYRCRTIAKVNAYVDELAPKLLQTLVVH